MNYSRKAVGLLKSQYLSVLKKCALINAGLFILSAPAMAADEPIEINSDAEMKSALSNGGSYILKKDVSINVASNKNLKVDKDISIDGGNFTITSNLSTDKYIDFKKNLKLLNVIISNIHEIRISGETTDNILQNVQFINNNSDDEAVFYSSKKNNNIVMENVKFINNSSKVAVISNKGTLKSILNATFKENTGGAIQNYEKIESLKESVFELNTSSDSGGAIYNKGSIDYLEAGFIQNKVSSTDSNVFGGAIYNIGKITDSGSNFEKNSIISDTGQALGGAIYNEGTFVFNNNVKFIDNSATTNGGAIYNKGTIDFNDSAEFSGNTVNGVANAIHNEVSGVINLNSGNMVFNDAITGSGTINIKTNGNINFNDLVSAKNVKMTAGNLELKSGAELGGVQDFVMNGGVLNVDDKTISLKNATFNDGSTVAIKVKSDGNGLINADSLTVNGGSLKATLGQGIVEKGSKTVTLLKSGTAFVDNFDSVADNNMYRFEKAEKAGDYIISLAKTAEEVSQENGGTKNNADAAKGWVDGDKFADGTTSADVADKLADLAQNDAKGFNEALSALAPADAPLVRTISVNHNNQVFSAVARQLDDSAARQKAYGLASGDTALLDGVGVWAQVMDNRIKLDDNARAYGFEVNDYGVALGVEKQLSSSVKAGVGYSYFNDDADAYLRDVDVDTHTAFIYGEYRPNNWYVNGTAAYGWSDYNETKRVAGDIYKAKYDVDNIGAQVMTGYNASAAKVDVTPEAGLRYNNIHRDNYMDGAGQAVKAKTMDVLTAVAGVKTGKDLVSCFGARSFYWRPEARLAATYDLISDKESAVVGLSNGSSYVVDGQRVKRFGVEAGAGVTFYFTPKVEGTIGYEGKFRTDYTDHTGYANLKYKF